MFRPNADRARQEIVTELDRGPRSAWLFLGEWPLRPTDMLVRKEYRELLMGLEREGTIAVFDSTTGIEQPAAKRRKNTLAEHTEIRRRQK